MAQPGVEERLKTVSDVARQLLHAGEQHALHGQLPQAEVLLAQVWTLTEGRDQELANLAAWHIAWLWVQLGNYTRAAGWFERVSAPPRGGSQLWPAARQALVRLCKANGNDSPQLPPTLEPPPLPEMESVVTPAASSLPPLEVISLGRFQVVRAGELLPVCRSRKASAIFRYLLARRNHIAESEELMELLWPEAHPRQAAQSLHVAVSALRRYLDTPAGSYVLLEGHSYLLNPDAQIADDCLLFQQFRQEGERCFLAGDLERAQEAYTRALAYYQGDYHVADHNLAWAVAERERLLGHYLSALDHLGQICMALGRWEQAIEFYQRLLGRDEYREDVYAQLMRCYLQLGRRNEALREYDRCAALLANDLGLEPAGQLQALLESIAPGGAQS